jgi:hypothetical protein
MQIYIIIIIIIIIHPVRRQPLAMGSPHALSWTRGESALRPHEGGHVGKYRPT